MIGTEGNSNANILPCVLTDSLTQCGSACATNAPHIVSSSRNTPLSLRVSSSDVRCGGSDDSSERKCSSAYSMKRAPRRAAEESVKCIFRPPTRPSPFTTVGSVQLHGVMLLMKGGKGGFQYQVVQLIRVAFSRYRGMLLLPEIE